MGLATVPFDELYAAYRVKVAEAKAAREERDRLGAELTRRYAERDARLSAHIGRAAAGAIPAPDRFAVLAKLEGKR
ncbi:MAG TPA: hypothetical protein VFZ21_30905 [Gemmatimonadaceae bacterium]|nr:hypothetical protein [Gemmatimonadaceae bacterium]